MADFAPGDVVVCVGVPSWPFAPAWLVKGSTHRIETVFEGTTHDYRRAPGVTLVGRDHSPMKGIEASCFRKVRPASVKFTRQIRACKPIKQPSRELVDSIPVHPRGDTL